jgi:hypothetical protein
MYWRFLIGLHSEFESLAGSVPSQFPLFGAIPAGNAEALPLSTIVALELSVEACTRSVSV